MYKTKKFRSAAKCARYVAPIFKRNKWTWTKGITTAIPTQTEIREALLEMRGDLNGNRVVSECGRLRVEKILHNGRIYYIAPVDHIKEDYHRLPVTK